jgi:hypothetical protein
MRRAGRCVRLVRPDPTRRWRGIVANLDAARPVHVVTEAETAVARRLRCAGASVRLIDPRVTPSPGRLRAGVDVVLLAGTHALWAAPHWRRWATLPAAYGVDTMLALPFLPPSLDRRLRSASAIAHAGVRHVDLERADRADTTVAALARVPASAAFAELADTLAAGGRAVWVTLGDVTPADVITALGTRGLALVAVRQGGRRTTLALARRGASSAGRLTLSGPDEALRRGDGPDLVVADLAPIDVLLELAVGLAPARPLLVRGPRPGTAATATWFAEALPKAAHRYRDHGLVWVGAEAIAHPDRPATTIGALVDEVYRRTAEGRFPPMLNTAARGLGDATA